MASTVALTVVATVRFSRTHLDTLIINAGRTEQWCYSNGVAWHRQAGRHAVACMEKKEIPGAWTSWHARKGACRSHGSEGLGYRRS